MRHLHYLGPSGSFSQEAAEKFAALSPDTLALQAKQSLFQVAKSLGDDDFAILPYYNFIDGLIQETIDYLYRYDLFICHCIRLQVDYVAGIVADSAGHCRIYAHQKGLAQTSEWIGRTYPDAQLIALNSNPEAIEKLGQDSQGVAVAGIKAFDGTGLQIIARDIANSRDNYTDFYVVSRNKVHSATGELTMVAISPRIDRVGLLADILNLFRIYGINCNKIHSRPALATASPLGKEAQMFYLELACNHHETRFQDCIASIGNGVEKDCLKLLGCYSIAQAGR